MTDLTHQVIQKEIRELRELFTHKTIVVPGIWECVRPGFLTMLWMAAVPAIIGYAFSDRSTLWFTSPLSLVITLFFMACTANSRALYLSIPESFRKKSLIFSVLGDKLRAYYAVYSTLYTIAVIACGASGLGGVWSFVWAISSAVLFVFALNFDLSRYQLSALSDLIIAAKESQINTQEQSVSKETH